MITYSIIRKSQFESPYRIDAEYFQPEYLYLIKALKKVPTIQLGSIAFVTDGIHSSIDYDNKSNIRCLSAQSVQDNYFDLSANTFISEQQHKMNLRTSLKRDDVILSSVGTIGNCAVVTDDILPANADRHVAIIRLSNRELSSSYLSAFLNSKYGRFQTFRESTGNVQLNLFIDKIKTLIIPILKNHREIGELAKKSYNMILFANSLYSQAEDLLLNELGLKDFKIEDDLTYTVNLSDIKSAHRSDAEYFHPKYEKLINNLNLIKSKLIDLSFLNEIFSIRRGDFIAPEYYIEKSRQAYIRIKELPSAGDINLDSIMYIDDNFVNSNLETLLEGDFVFAGIGATLGKTARIPKELEGSFYSNNTVRFRLRKVWKDKADTYYLQVILQSKICQLQFEQRQAQTAQAKIADEELKTVLIPILPQSTQQKIADLVRQSHEAHKKAKEFLEQAKKEVEELIENQ